MAGLSISADVDGKGLEEVNRLLSRRIAECGEHPRLASLATASDVLTSIRALTRVAKVPHSIKDVFSAYFPRFECLKAPGKAKRPPYTASYTTSHKKCVRFGVHVLSEHGDGMFVNAVKGRWPKDTFELGVWRVAYKPKVSAMQTEAYYIVADSPTEVRKWCLRKIQHRVRKFRGMARFAVSLAKMRLRTGAMPKDNVSRKARTVASNLVTVREGIAGHVYSLDIDDALNYAKSALRGGSAAVELATRKAANKISSRLQKTYGAFFRVQGKDDFHSPFPDLVKPKK